MRNNSVISLNYLIASHLFETDTDLSNAKVTIKIVIHNQMY